MLARVRDITRGWLHKTAKVLGENNSVVPESIVTKKKLKESLSFDWEEVEQLLPFDSVTDDHVFINTSTFGFGLFLSPASGADERLVNAHAELLKQRLPAGYDLTGILHKHHYIADDLYRGYEPLLQKGGIYEAIARMSLRYHINAIKKGYKTVNNIPTQLADFSCYLFIATKNKRGKEQELTELRVAIESELSVAGYNTSRMGGRDLKTLVRVVTSPDMSETYWPECEDEPNERLSKSMVKPNTTMAVNSDSVDITVTNDEGQLEETRVVNLMIQKWPKRFALWSTPDLFANIFSPDKGIQCPFMITFIIRGVNQEQVRQEAKAKSESLSKSDNGVQRFLNPSLSNEKEEWMYVHAESNKNNLAVMPTFYNIMLFTSKALESKHIAQTLSAYREFGFELVPKRMSAWNRFITSLPFIATEGIFDGLAQVNNTKRLSHYTCANLLPFVSDFKGSPQGMMLPTTRGQIAYVDTFDDKHLPITNYNFSIRGTPGSGKSLLCQNLILQGLGRGQKIFVLDLGDSYKHLCELVGGTYINASTLSLNPFSLFDFSGDIDVGGKTVKNAIQIRDLLAMMIDPHEKLASVENAYLLDAVERCWAKHGQRSCIDDVMAELHLMMDSPESQGDGRLRDLIVLLKKYSKESTTYGSMFNSETTVFSDNNFIVLEMGEFENDPELLAIIMYVMIIVIQGQFYHSDRDIKKLCIIDEAWRFLSGNSHPLAAKFIEQGFRTARKYNGGFGVSFQGLGGTNDSSQARAVADCSDTKIIMRQRNFDEHIQSNPQSFDARQQRLIKSFGAAKAQGFSDLMVQYEEAYTFHRYFADPFTRILFSSNAGEFSTVERYVNEGLSISEAVHKAAEKFYGDELCIA